MEIVYVKAIRSKNKAGGFYIKTHKGYISIFIQSGISVDKFGDDAEEFPVQISAQGEVITDGIKRVETQEVASRKSV